MASLNLSSNGPSITKSYQSVVNSTLPSSSQGSSPTYGQWVVYTVAAPLVSAFQQDSGKESVLKVQSTGEGELVDLVDEFSDGRIQFAFLKVRDPNTTLPKSVLIGWCGEGVPERTKGYFTSHLAAVSKLLHGYHVQVTARSDRDLTPEGIIQKVTDASGAKYGGGPTSTSSAASAPPVASKPAFMPTRLGGGGGGFNPLGSKGRASNSQDHNVDEDGWGADAPQVTRTQLEKVASAYQPTKVNINDLTSQKSEPSKLGSTPAADSASSNVVKGAYQPIGKVDIAAIRRQAKETGQGQDDRPNVVKGAYEPIGKVDIAAIKARAQVPTQASAPSSAQEHEEAPKSLAERSSAFTPSGVLTSLPKPKVTNKFGSSSTFTGTKAPSPGGFQGQSPIAAPQVGLASKTYADEGGKTPAQLWAEKKGRERGNSGAALTSAGPPALSSQPSGDSGFKSGYTGKSWAAIQTTRTGQSVASNNSQQNNAQEETHDETSSVGVSSIRDRFKGGAPMGAPSTSHASDSSAPAPDLSSKPNAGARGVPMPGLPTRPSQDQVPAEEHFDIPSPPRQPRSPTPETPDEMRSSSPIRIAQPVGRGTGNALQAAEELHEPAPIPAASIARAIPPPRELSPEPQIQDEEPARAAAEAVASTNFGAGADAGSGGQSGGQRAVAQYDYEKAESNELELREGELVINIDMVDDDWWMGQNEKGETGLFPSNYVELVEDEEPAAPAAAAPAPVAPSGPSSTAAAAAPKQQTPTATAIYDYDAAEENELSFPDGAKVTDVEFPDEDWWFGHYGGKSGLFPSNYVQLDE